MARRSELLSDTSLAKADDGMHSEPRDTPGCALEIRKCNGGETMPAYFRYNGTKWGERRCMRIPLGPYHRGNLLKLRNKCVAYEQLIAQGKSPTRFKERAEEQLRSAGMTFREALKEYWEYTKKVSLWNGRTRYCNDKIRKKHIERMPLMDMPIEDIRGVHMDENFGDKWRASSSIGPHIRSLIHSTLQYQIDKDDGVYRGPNPASWREGSSASRALGAQLPSQPHPGVHWKDIPKVFAYFSRPMDHWVPGYLSTRQIAGAWELDEKAVRELYAYEKFEGVIKSPPIFKKPVNLYPKAEVLRVLGKPKHEPKPHEHESLILNAALMRFLILCPVRPSNATYLRWRNIREDIEGGVIVYMPKRRDRATGLWLPSEHKNGWRYDFPYIAILTDNLREIFEEQRQIQIRNDIEITQDGFVFLHGRCRTGRGDLFNKPSSHTTLIDYISKACKRLTAAGQTIRIIPEGATSPTTAGLRGATFTTWAKEHRRYTDDEIDLSLGHVISAIRNNPTNWSYFWGVQMISERRKMMTHWERHVMSLVKPLRNVTEFVPKSA
jgi:integrase